MLEVLQADAAAAGVIVQYLDDDELAQRRADLAPFTAVFVQHLRADSSEALGDLLLAARRQNPKLRAFALSGAPRNLSSKPEHQGLIERDEELQRYYGGSKDNLRRLLQYARVRIAGQAGSVEPPLASAPMGAWHPQHQELMDLAQFEAFVQQRGADYATRPRVAVAVHTIHLQFQQPAVVQALVEALERHGLCAFGIVDSSEGLAALAGRYEELLAALHPDAVVHTCHSTDRLDLRQRLDVPHLTSIFFRKKSIDAWAVSADGIDAAETVFQVAGQELLGAIEPQVGAGTRLGGGSDEAFTPIAERIDHLARRTAAWVALRHQANADKRIAVVYWDREMDKASLLRGSASGMFLNAPRSLLAVFERLQREGYRTDGAPADEAGLIEQLIGRGRQIPMADRDELEQLVQHGDPVLLPVAQYERWLQQYVPPSARAALEQRWGKAPGDIMVWRDAEGRACFVIPRLQYGNLTLLPQPLRGEAHDNRAVHDKLTCPPHHYLATYLWLQHGLQADALVHFGTHGSELMLPGKAVGLGPDDWPDLCMGDLPDVYPWVVENLGEAMIAKRRAYAVLIGHQPAPTVDAGLSDALRNLHDDLEKWRSVAPGALRRQFQQACSRAITAQHLDLDLHLTATDGVFDDAALQRVDDYLHDIMEQPVPTELHVLGQPPSGGLLVPYLTNCLRRAFLDHLAPRFAGAVPEQRAEHLRPVAEQIVRGIVEQQLTPAAALLAAGAGASAVSPELEKDFEVLQQLRHGLQQSGRELDALVHALAGAFVEPGPGRGPDRNPGVLPTGRNLYSLNPDEVPSHASWQLGKQLAETLLQQHRDEHGHYPQKVAFALSSFATFQDYGVMEAQILWLLGCEPVWDERNLVREVKVVPRQQLGRPRVDVLLSALSYYRDSLPSRMVLIDRAIRMVSDLDEADNQVRRGTEHNLAELQRRGVTAEAAAKLAPARIFGRAPGVMSSANYYYLVERSGDWDSRGELMEMYLANTSSVYTEGAWGEAARQAYETAMQGTEVVLRTWYDTSSSPLSNKYTWFTGGSLAQAIEHVTGRKPDYSFVDLRDPDNARIDKAEDALRRDFHARLFNRKWIEGMQQQGYAGADQIAVMVSNVFGWQVMREGSIRDDDFERIQSVFLDDSMQLGLREFFAKVNPFAEQEIAELLLEAARKQLWQHADPQRLRQIAERLQQSIRQHGKAGGIREAGNGKTSAFAAQLLAPAAATAAASAARSPGGAVPVEAAAQPPPTPPMPDTDPPRETVRGQKLEPVASALPRQFGPWLLAAGAALLFLIGFLRRRG